MKQATALDLLKRGRAKIANPDDWGKGMRFARENKGTCCAAEAIEESEGYMTASHSERRLAIRALRNTSNCEDGWGGLTNWNDAPERTHAEVMAAFNLAIACLRL